MYVYRPNQFKALRSMAIGITSVLGLRTWADEIGCADSTGVTGYILERDEARPTQSHLSTQMIMFPSTIWRSSDVACSASVRHVFWVGFNHGANIAATRNPFEMSHYKDENQFLSRRRLLKSLGLAPMLFCPAPFQASSFLFDPWEIPPRDPSDLSFADVRLTPHYPSKSPLEDVLRLVAPGSDEYITEKYAFEIDSILGTWSTALKKPVPDLSVLLRGLDRSIEGCSLAVGKEITLRAGGGLAIVRRQFRNDTVRG